MYSNTYVTQLHNRKEFYMVQERITGCMEYLDRQAEVREEQQKARDEAKCKISEDQNEEDVFCL